MVAVALALGCGSDGKSSRSASGGAGGTAGEGGGGGNGGLVSGSPGTHVRFDLNADLTQPEEFYALPFPSDLHLDSRGRPNLTGFPYPFGNAALESLRDVAQDRDRWAVNPVVYFRFDGPLSNQIPSEVIAASPSSPILLVDLGAENGDGAGTLYPTIAQTSEADTYLPENVLAVAALPGVMLPPGHKIACVVQRSLLDSDGEPLGTPDVVAQLLASQTPEDGDLATQAGELFAGVGDALVGAGIVLEQVAAVTVFTTGTTVKNTFELSERVRANHTPEIENLAVDPDDGADHERFCELHGSVTLPQFQAGEPPFDEDGLFRFEGEELSVQRQDSVPVVITLPKREMPADGFPWVIYAHGTSGLSDQVVDRGPVLEPGGEQQKGLGPAHVLAAHGFASVGYAHVLNEERLPGGPNRAYLNLNNLPAYRDTYRQDILDTRLLIDALTRVEISPAALSGCDGVQLPSGDTVYSLADHDIFHMGQSAGAATATLVGAIDPRITAVAPTGSGGYYSLLMVVGVEFTGGPGLLNLLVGTTAELSILHPSMMLLELAWEAAEPAAFAPHIGANPLPGHPARHIYTPMAEADSFFPEPVFDAMALAYGVQRAGDSVWPEMDQGLDAAGLGGLASYPVQLNRTSAGGEPWTGIVVQYQGDGLADPHGVFAQLDDVKHQYGCFLQTALSGTATVPAPAALGTPCTE